MKLTEEGILTVDGGGAFWAAKSLYPDAKAFCEAVAMKGDDSYGEPVHFDDLDYLIAHTKIAYAHHCVGNHPCDGDVFSTWWQIEDEPGCGRTPIWYLDLN